MKEYLRNGTVSRSKIVDDIKNGNLGKEEIAELVKRRNVVDSFIGSNYPNKVGKDQWNEKYLEKLVLTSVAESFNEDYLYYLYDVTKYVRDNKRKRKGLLSAVAIISGIVALVAVIILIVMAIKK